MKFRPVFFFLGILLAVLAVTMLVPAIVDLAYYNNDWKVFAAAAAFTGFFGGALVLVTRSDEELVMGVRQAFLLTTLGWFFLAFFAALPFVFCTLDLDFTNAFFESVSGITTTGATVISNLAETPPGILIWRAMLQWLGGIGIIVMAMSVLPFLQVGGMQLFKTESSESEKAMPRTTQLAAALGLIYLALTLVCVSFYFVSGMSLFDAVTHAMTTVSTGGFGTHSNSFAWFANMPGIQITAVSFMILGSLPFVLYLRVLQGRSAALFKDSQVRWFLSILLLGTIVVGFHLVHFRHMGFAQAFSRAGFQITSMMTGTGFTTVDYNLWGPLGIGVLFFLMCVGGCAGSTTCGIKVFRFQILYAITRAQINRLLHPRGIFKPYYNGKPVVDGVPISVMSFFFMFALIFAVLVVVLQLFGLDFVTAMSGAAATLSNAGPGMGSIIGPMGSYAPLPAAVKWILSFAMVLGRLELFTVLILFLPGFWRR